MDGLLVEQACSISKEMYLAFILDRNLQMPAIICSKEGGVDIEQVAEQKPHAILRLGYNPIAGLSKEQLQQIVSFLGLAHVRSQAVSQLRKLASLFQGSDAT